MRRIAFLLIVISCGCGGPDFDSPSEILGPRLLAIIAEPPETEPGVDVALTAVTALAEGSSVEWTIDLSPNALAASAGQDLFEAREPVGFSGTISGEDTQAAIDELYTLVEDAPPGTPEHVVRFVYEEVGLVLLAQVVVRHADGRTIAEGFKRVSLTPRPMPTVNPPPPRFRIGDRWASARGMDPSRCVAEAEPLETRAGELIELGPDPEESWLETYPALDLEGGRVLGIENAYYSWFSTGGDFQFDVTRSPESDVEWTAPETPGDYEVWLVVRDGHLGTSACSATLRVTP